MNDQTNQPDRLGYVRALLARHRWRFVLASVGAAMIVIAASLALPRKYEAEAIFERHNDLVMHELTSQGRAPATARLRNTAKADLLSRPTVNRVVDRLGLADQDDPAAPNRRQLVDHLMRNLRVSVDLATANLERVRVTLIDEQPDRAQAVVNELVQVFIEDSRDQREGSLNRAAAFFEQRRGASEQRIEELEAARLAFEIKHAELLPDEQHTLQQRIAETETTLLEARQRKESADRWLSALQQQIAEDKASDEPTVSIVMKPNPQIAAIDEQLEQYQARIEQKLTAERMTRRHPAVVSLQSKIDELRARRADLPAEIQGERRVATSQGPDPTQMSLAQARSEAEAAAAAVKLAETQLARLQALNSRVFPVRSAYRRIERDLGDEQRQVDFWNENLQRVKMARAVETGQDGANLRFVQPCGKLSVPSSPDPIQVLFVALAAGVAVGVLALLASDRTDRTFTNLQDAAADLGLPILGATGELVTARAARWRAFSQRVVFPACVLLLLATLGVASYAAYTSLTTPESKRTFWQQKLGALIGQPAGPDAAAARPQGPTHAPEAKGV